MTARAYYNENDPFAAGWLEELIIDGLIAPGDVDERSITEVQPDDLEGYTQCHFFAGIGGWSYALRLAGWPDDKPVWTGSCPCQPLSSAGLRRGHLDERHLWPAFHALIAERRPATLFGEQVASKDGREWLCAVRADMEGLGYALGAADLCAAGAGAPHIRQRLFFVAYPLSAGWSEGWPGAGDGSIAGRSGDGVMADCDSPRSFPGALTGLRGGEESSGPRHGKSERCGSAGSLADTDADRRITPSFARVHHAEHHAEPRVALGDAIGSGLEIEHRVGSDDGSQQPAAERTGSAANFWADAEWIACRDGKARPTKPGLFPLAHGFPNRVGILRGAGNAINPVLAAEFIAAARETLQPVPRMAAE